MRIMSRNDKIKPIKIKKSSTADSRTCDVSKVTKDQLKNSSFMHLEDIHLGTAFLIKLLKDADRKHDFDKIEDIDGFYSNFKSNFQNREWLDNHYKIHRHHLNENTPEDVNLIDVLEMIVDCTMAGLGRSGEARPIELSNELLQDAVKNTTNLLVNNTEIVE